MAILWKFRLVILFTEVLARLENPHFQIENPHFQKLANLASFHGVLAQLERLYNLKSIRYLH